MRNFLILTGVFFSMLILSAGQTAYAQCPVTADVVVRTHTNVSCFGANDGTITVDITDAATSEPFNFELFDLGAGTIVTFLVTETENKPGRGVVYSNVPPGTYSVLFFKPGCYGGFPLSIIEPPFGFVITEPTALVASIDDIDPDCNATVGVGNGQVDISRSGGTAPYTVVWSGPTPVTAGTLSTPANLDAGNYTVTITDANGCDEVLNIVVPVTTPADAGPATGVACGGNSFTLSGNAFAAGEIGTWTGPAGVTFSPNANTPTATANNLNVGANVLTWTITDAGFVCTGSSDNITITHSNVDITGSADVVLPCFGATTGMGTFTVSGGIAPFTYSVVSNTSGATIVLPAPGPTTSVSFTNGGAGVVTLQVQDNSGCTDQVSINLTQPASAITVTRSPVGGTVNLLCNGDTNGSGSFTASGGTGAHTFTIVSNTTGGTTSIAGSVLSFTGAGAGTISIEVRDANNCLQTSSITVAAPAALVLTPSPATGTIALLCNGDTNGSGSFTASGGTGAHTFTIVSNTTGGTTSVAGSVLSFTGAGAGAINVEVRDANNCVQTSSITITAPAALVLTPSPATGTIALLCSTDTNGAGSFTASGGTGAHTFTILSNTTGGTTSTVGSVLSFTGAGAGTISIEVRDANACLQSSSITITAPPALVLTPSPATGTIDLLCNGDTNGAGSFTATGGTGAHTFSIVTNTTGGTTSALGSVFSFTGAGAGTISIEVRDANNCLQTASITINAPAALVLTPSPATGTIDLLCNGDTNGTGSFTASGGTGAHTFTIVSNTTGGTTSTAGSVLSFTGAGAGTISIEVRDANACLQTSSITITAPAALVLTPSAATGTIDLLCNGDTNGSGSFTASGGTGAHTFSIVSNTTGGVTSTAGSVLSFTGAGPGTITVEVRDANVCLQTSSITITAPSVLTLTDPSDVSLTCTGGNNAAGTFTAAGGTVPYAFTVDTNTTSATTSSTATAFSFAGGGPGMITVTVTDANGCTATQTVNVTSASTIVASAGVSTDATCLGINDGAINGLSATGGDGNYEFSLNGGAYSASTTIPNLSAGSYAIEARDGTGCISPPITVVVNPGTSITYDLPIVNTIPTSCGGNDATISVTNVTGGSGSYIYILNGIPSTPQGSSFLFTGLTAGNYQVQVQDNTSGCLSAIEPVTIGNPSGCVLNCFAYNIIVDETLTKRPSCNGGNDGVIALRVSGNPGNIEVSLIPPFAPTEIRPSGSTFIFSNLSEGSYQYQIFDGSNICVRPFIWNVAQNIVASTSSPQDAPCFGVPSGSAVISASGSATGDYFYSIDGTTWTEFLPGNVVTGLPGNGTYDIRIGGVANDPCFAIVSVTINQLGTAALDTLYVSPVTGFPAVSYPESPTATRVIGIKGSGSPPYNFDLRLVESFGIEVNPPFFRGNIPVDETSPEGVPQKRVDALYAGIYELTVRDASGCERVFNFTIELDDRIFIPNIFTPNKSDDYNSMFFVRNLPEKGSRLLVSDRWGKEVFTSNDYNPNTLWDGGETPDGVYFYRLQIKGGKTYTGWVEILRGTKR